MSRPFTSADDARLIRLRDQGASRAEIGSILGRTEGSIKERIRYLQLPTVRGKQDAPRAWRGLSSDFSPKATVNHSLEWREFAKQREAELKRAAQHAARVKALGPVSNAEAEALIAAALAAGKVTLCPPRFVAPITGAPA
jgi:hypothetical protein